MTLFQWLALIFLGGLLVREITWFARGRVLRAPWAVRCLVWISAALAIAFPDVTQQLATFVGITRGTDLVLYVFVLAFLGTAFYFYSRYVRMERQLTQIVRHLALREARQGPDLPS